MTKIDLSKFASASVRVLSGRDRGLDVRKALDLSKYDTGECTGVMFVVPRTIPFVNSSFFLGLIGDSVQALGREEFLRRFSIEADPRVERRFQQAIDRVLLKTAPLP